MHYFVDPNEQAARGLPTMDDVDIIYSQKDGAMVTVAQNHGVHVCWYCGDMFEHTPTSKKRGVEVSTGGEWGTRILLHAGCVGKKPREHRGGFLGRALNSIQSNRMISKVTKPFLGK